MISPFAPDQREPRQLPSIEADMLALKRLHYAQRPTPTAPLPPQVPLVSETQLATRPDPRINYE
jgi:pleiotropic regulator 1